MKELELELPEVFSKLEELIWQNELELVIRPSKENDGKEEYRLVYLMNDAVESFLFFENGRLTGEYQSDYEGEIDASLHREDSGYVLIITQGETVFTLFFTDLLLEVNLYNYGQTGHFWVEGYEYLRQMEYKISILRDKRDYLGEKYCNDLEMELSELTAFPPLNYCCYPSAPEKYIVPRKHPWRPGRKALKMMQKQAWQSEDKGLYFLLYLYGLFPVKSFSRYIAALLRQEKHAGVVDLISNKLVVAAGMYPERDYPEEEKKHYQKLLEKAIKRCKELQKQGIYAQIYREEPFVAERDSIEFKVYLMIWKCVSGERVVEIEEI